MLKRMVNSEKFWPAVEYLLPVRARFPIALFYIQAGVYVCGTNCSKKTAARILKQIFTWMIKRKKIQSKKASKKIVGHIDLGLGADYNKHKTRPNGQEFGYQIQSKFCLFHNQCVNSKYELTKQWLNNSEMSHMIWINDWLIDLCFHKICLQPINHSPMTISIATKKSVINIDPKFSSFPSECFNVSIKTN